VLPRRVSLGAGLGGRDTKAPAPVTQP
jgi:hypothetical protein